MKRGASLGGLVLLVVLAVQVTQVARAEDVRATDPNGFSVEALGRGILYSLDYDRVVDENIAVGVGIGTVGTKFTNGSGNAGQTAVLLPIYANYYFVKDQGSVFATGGVDIVLNNGNVQGLSTTLGGVTFNSSGVVPTFGLGYETRSDSGVLARVAVYGMVAQSVSAWVGLTLGLGM